MLNRFNLPINEYRPKLNILGHSILAEFIICHGWNFPLERLNKKPEDIQKVIELREFEGLVRI